MKLTVIASFIAFALIALALVVRPKADIEPIDNVSIENGVQYIDIGAKGGYSPRETVAQAGMPTVLRVSTNATYDCSAALTVPSIKYSEFLPPSGTTTIDIPPQEPGAVVRGLCSMGMYSFAVRFEEESTTN